MKHTLPILFSLTVAGVLGACGTDTPDNPEIPTPSVTESPAGDNSGNPNANWAAVSGAVACATAQDCPGREGFIVESDGLYRIGAQPYGFLESSDFADLNLRANAYSVAEIQDARECIDNSGSAPVDRRAISIRGLPASTTGSSTSQVIAETLPDGDFCYRGELQEARDLDISMNAIMQRYDPVTGPIPCTDQFVYGLTVEVDDTFGAPVTNASVVITEGGYSEQLIGPGVLEPGTYTGAGERAGRYTLTISAPGYNSYRENNVIIPRDVCHVQPVRREVILGR